MPALLSLQCHFTQMDRGQRLGCLVDGAEDRLPIPTNREVLKGSRDCLGQENTEEFLCLTGLLTHCARGIDSDEEGLNGSQQRRFLGSCLLGLLLGRYKSGSPFMDEIP